MPSTEAPARLRPLAVAAVVMVLVALGGFLVSQVARQPATLATEGQFAQPQNLPLLPGDISLAQWMQYEEPFTGLPGLSDAQRITVEDVASDGEVAWAVGHIGDETMIEERQRPRLGVVWRTDDGRSWEPVDVESIAGTPVDEGTELNLLYDVELAPDGAIWVVGREVVLGEVPGGEVWPVLYWSADGRAWERIEIPGVAAGDYVIDADVEEEGLLLVVETGEFDDAQRRLLRFDGAEWVTEEDPRSSTARAVLHAGVSVDVDGEELGDGVELLSGLVVGPTGFVVAAVEELPLTEEQLNNDGAWARLPNLSPQLWISSDGRNWSQLAVPQTSRPFKAVPKLFAHSEGVLATIDWADADDEGTSVFTVNSEEGVTYEGELPLGRFDGLFVLSDELLVIGSDESASRESVVEVDDVWVAAFDE